jgi:hypothetical protein
MQQSASSWATEKSANPAFSIDSKPFFPSAASWHATCNDMDDRRRHVTAPLVQ